MMAALQEYHSATEKPSIRQLARTWNVPVATLFKRIKSGTGNHEHQSGQNTVLTSAQEMELTQLIITLSKRGFPLTRQEIQKLAFEFAVRSRIRGFSSKKQRAGRYWFEGFMERHQNLSVRKPENLSAARAAGMNETVVQAWFAEYKDLITKLGIGDQPDRFWNCDETGVTEQFSQGLTVGEVAQPCYRITPGEKGETTTVLASFNAKGEYCPPIHH